MTQVFTNLATRFRRRAISPVVAAILILTGCAQPGGQSIDNTFTAGMLDPFEPELTGSYLLGAVAGDEPQSVLIGQEILKSGGTAGDAAAAVYFSLAVTDPERASLGGGGVCLAYNLDKTQIDTIAFPAVPVAGSPVGMPGNVKGFSLLQARHGRLPWGQVVAPAERLARQEKRDYAVAGVLSAIRTKGPSGFYSGAVGQQVTEALRQRGAEIQTNELTSYSAMLLEAEGLSIGDMVLYRPSVNYSGEQISQALQALVKDENFWQTPAQERDETVRKTLKNAGALLGQSVKTGTTSFATVDMNGNAVACAVSMNAPFGTGEKDPTTGLYFASSTTSDGASEWSGLLPLLAINGNTKKFYYSGVAAGGLDGAAKSLVLALDSVVTDEGSLNSAFSMSNTNAKGNAIFCRYGLKGDTRSCNAKSDGYALTVPVR